MTQADVQLLGKTEESFFIEFDQGKFEEFLSSGSDQSQGNAAIPQVSSETRSRISSKITPKVARTTAHSASGTTSEEVLKTSHAAHAAASTSLRRPAGRKHRHTIKVMVKINSVVLLSKLCNSKLTGVPNNPLRLNRNAECRRKHRAR